MAGEPAAARYVFATAVRGRVVGLLIGTGAALLAASYILTELTPGTERRTFFNAAYLGLEALAILAPLLASTLLQVQEFDQRTLWLVLVRRPTRAAYARARALGIAAAAWTVLLAVAAALTAFAAVQRALPEPWLGPVIWAACLEALVLSALAAFWVFVATSPASALMIQLGVVVVGYCAPLFPALAAQAPVALKPVVWGAYWLAPHLGNFAVRELAEPPEAWYLAWLTGYALCYAGAAAVAASVAASRREP